MKKLNLLYIIFCFYFAANAQIQVESFEGTSIPNGWSATTTSSGCEWVFGYTAAMPGTFFNPVFFTTGAAVFEDNYNVANPNSCGDNGYTVELEGPAVDLIAAGTTSAAVEIIYNHQTFSNDGDFMVDVWDGTGWQNILFVDGDMPSANSGTTKTSVVDVTPYINSAFKVKFIYGDENTVTYGIGIDNYQLMDTATAGIEDLLDSGFSYYPNPIVNDELTLKSNENISIVNIFNIIGQKVIAKKPVAFESKIQLQNLPAGVYIVQVVIGSKEGSFKVIKK